MWHVHVSTFWFEFVYLLSLCFTYKCTRVCMCTYICVYARVYPHSEEDFCGSWLRVNTHVHAPSRPHSHTHKGCCASAGARRPSSLVPPVCAGVSPRNFQLPNNKVPGWPNYCRERAARRARSLRFTDRYFVSRINKATPRAAARSCVLCCDFVLPASHLDRRRESWRLKRERGQSSRTKCRWLRVWRLRRFRRKIIGGI